MASWQYVPFVSFNNYKAREVRAEDHFGDQGIKGRRLTPFAVCTAYHFIFKAIFKEGLVIPILHRRRMRLRMIPKLKLVQNLKLQFRNNMLLVQVACGIAGGGNDFFFF